MEYQFQKKDFRKAGVTVVRCGAHWGLVYKVAGNWVYRVGFDPRDGFAPRDQYAYGSARNKASAVVQVEAAILGHGPDGVDWMDVDIRYSKWGS